MENENAPPGDISNPNAENSNAENTSNSVPATTPAYAEQQRLDNLQQAHLVHRNVEDVIMEEDGNRSMEQIDNSTQVVELILYFYIFILCILPCLLLLICLYTSTLVLGLCDKKWGSVWTDNSIIII